MLDVQLKDYQKLFDDITDEAEYKRLYLRAESLLRGMTTRRIDEVVDPSDFRYEQVKSAIIHVIHELHEKRGSSGVSIVSNDGYTEHYTGMEAWKESLEANIQMMLSGTGLMRYM